MKTSNLVLRLAAGIFLSLTFSTSTPLAHAQTLEVLHTFQGSDGSAPYAGLVQGNDGSFYGTTEHGGDLSQLNGIGAGTVFTMTTKGTLTTLVSFNSSNGRFPHGLVQGSDNNFYGTTSSGGDLSLNNGNGYGTIFRMKPDATLTTLVRFNNSNGASPYGALVEGSDRNFYGTTEGVNVGAFGGSNYGTVFRMTPNGTLTTLVRFNSSNGRYPEAGPVVGSDGNFYGTTAGGGTAGGETGRGTVFKMTPNGVLTTLATFNGSNGANALSKLVQDLDGNFYGTTTEGGAFGGGTVFKMTSDGVLTTLFSFDIAPNRYLPGPWAGLVRASDGNFYGTTHGGNDKGTVFQMTPGGGLTTLVRFDGTNGAFPEAPLVQGSDGNLYGTTSYFGGANGQGTGTVFRILMPPALPRLDITRNGNQIVLSWPVNAAGFVLESIDSLSPPMTWTPVSETPTITGGQNTIAVSDPRGRKFYRLRKPD